MKTTLKMEELAQFMVGIVFFSQLDFAWWIFPTLLFLPDLSMLGYLVNHKVGAIGYNLFHHKALAIVIGVIGLYLNIPAIMLVGIILFSHASLDRIFGYGLKYFDSFNHTHLGKIGK